MNKTLTAKAIESNPRRYGKSTLITNQFLASCKDGQGVEYRHPDYTAMSNKRYQELVEEAKDKAEESVMSALELWFSTYDKLSKNFQTDELLKFIKNEI